jgi:peptide/nickel transport system ATP-binding protein
MTLLSIQNLNLSIQGTPILKNVSLDIAQGEILAITGESGSGKSLTAFSVLQLLPRGTQTSGTIQFGEHNLLDTPEHTLCTLRGNDIGMIFQEPMTALNPLKTIGDQVMETILQHTKTSRADASKRRNLQLVSLSARAVRRPAAAGRHRNGHRSAPAPAYRRRAHDSA